MRCTAHRSDGAECRAHAIKGARVCRVHGGSSPKVRKAAERRLAVASAEKAAKVLAAVSEPAVPITDPLAALATLAGEAWRWKDLLSGVVAHLDGLRYGGVVGEQVRGEITLFGQALDRCNTILSTVARLNLDERIAVVEEKRAELLAELVRRALEDPDLALTTEQAALAPVVIARHLRAVTS